MNKKFIFNPFHALYRDDIVLNDCPEIQKLDRYARNLKDKIQEDFDLNNIVFEFNYNRLAYVRNGLLLAKIKFLKLYQNFGDRTFATFCKEQLKITRWQVNDTIKAARVTMELIYAGFEILPTNISQAIALASLAKEELIKSWQKVIDNIKPDLITHKSIRSLLFPSTEKEPAVATIKVPAALHEDIHREVAERGLSIVDLIATMFNFFIGSGNSHLLKYQQDRKKYTEKERIWQKDLKDLTREDRVTAMN